MRTYVRLQYLIQYFLEWEMLRTNVVQKTKTQIYVQKRISKNWAVYEIMCKNVVELDRTQMAI